VTIRPESDVIRPLAETEKYEIIRAVLYAEHIMDAAVLLGIGKTTLYRKLKRYGLSLKSRPELVKALKSE